MQKKITILFVLTLTIILIGCNKKATTTEEKTDSNTQQILENDNFLNSADGMKYQINAWYFAKAFFNGDLDYIKNNLVDSNQLEDYNYKNQFSQIEYIVFKMHEYDSETKTVYGEYAVQIDKNDGCKYLEFRMKLDDNGDWKIISYSVDA